MSEIARTSMERKGQDGSVPSLELPRVEWMQMKQGSKSEEETLSYRMKTREYFQQKDWSTELNAAEQSKKIKAFKGAMDLAMEIISDASQNSFLWNG